MLVPAQLYTTQLKIKFWEVAYDEKYMFMNDGYTIDYTSTNSTWVEHEFVSVNVNGELLGYIRYSINQRVNKIFGFCAINFSDDKITFGIDLGKSIDDIFNKYKYNKLIFGVTIGNPVEKTYDKMVKRYNGRIIGIKKEDIKLIDGNIYDSKMYEILRKDYIIATKERRIK